MTDNILTDEELEIEARANAATPGPWESVTVLPAGSRSTGDGGYESWSESPWRIVNGPPQATSDDMLSRRAFINPADADFIAHAREDVPRLLAEVKRLRKELLDTAG